MIESLHKYNHFFQLPLLDEIPLIKNKEKQSLYLVYPELLGDDLLNILAGTLSSYISEDYHMLSVSSQDIIDSVRQGLSVMIVDSNFSSPIGYGRFYLWKREKRSCCFGIRKRVCYVRFSRSWNWEKNN